MICKSSSENASVLARSGLLDLMYSLACKSSEAVTRLSFMMLMAISFGTICCQFVMNDCPFFDRVFITSESISALIVFIDSGDVSSFSAVSPLGSSSSARASVGLLSEYFASTAPMSG